MRRLALLPLTALLLALLAGSGLVSLADTPSPSASPSGSPSPTVSGTPYPIGPPPAFSPIPTPVSVPFETPAPTPSGPRQPGELRRGDWVQVTGTDSCLNARFQPGFPKPAEGQPEYDNIVNCIPDGFIGRLADGELYGQASPVQMDGYWWWYVTGVGWLAQDWLVFHHEGGIPWPERPELADAGLIAFLRPDGIWVMNADGSDQRLLYARASTDSYIDYLAWSPGGTLLSFTEFQYDGTGPHPVTRLIDASGATYAEFPEITHARWSPDGNLLSALTSPRDGGLGWSWGRLVVVGVDTGTQTIIGPENSYAHSAVWSPNGYNLAFICRSWTSTFTATDGTLQEQRMECGQDGLQVTSVDGSHGTTILPMDESSPYYDSPSWSPAGDYIALFGYSEQGCRGYTLVDVSGGTIETCIELPPPGGGLGGRCGGSSEYGATDWSADGSRLLYHGEYGKGENGVYIYDLATGGTTVIPLVPASSISVGGVGRVAFSAGGYVWVADQDGSGLAMLAQGDLAAWQPAP